MPVTNNNSQPNPFAKAVMYVSDTYSGTYVKNKRVNIKNFRTQYRGLGGCSFDIFPKDQRNEQIDQTIKEGQFVKILDGTVFFEDEYSSVGDELFFGTVSSVTVDTYSNKDDEKGYGTADEIGHYYSKKPIIWNSKPQVFNPIVSGKAYGNKKHPSENLEFETILANMEVLDYDGVASGSLFPDTNPAGQGIGNKKVWSLEEYLRYMASISNVEILFPWDFDNQIMEQMANAETEGLDEDDPEDAQIIQNVQTQLATDKEANEKLYFVFKYTLEVKSYDHYDGKSFQQLLADNLPEPFDWFFKNVSTGYPTIQIINKSPIKITDFCPAAQLVTKRLESNITTNFNITKQDEVYDKVIYRGQNILVAGTLGHWNCNHGASMERTWTDAEENAYIAADNESDAASCDIKRSEDKKVYQQFKYKHLEEACPIQIPKKLDSNKKYIQAPLYPTENGDTVHYDMVAFFPRIDFVNVTPNSEYILSPPNVYDSLSLHRTPPLLEIDWAKNLPWESKSEKEVKTPFVMAIGMMARSGKLFIYDITKSGGGFDTASFKHTVDGYRIEQNFPQTLAFYDDVLFRCSNGTIDTAANNWTSASLSKRNPETTNYEFLSNWKMIAATVAGYSDQKLEWSKTRLGAVGTKTKIIEDDSLECWFAHAGTIKKLVKTANEGTQKNANRTYINGVERFEKDTFIRNDFKKLYKYLEHASNWLFTEKASGKFEFSLTKYAGGYGLGEVIETVLDGQISRPLNTSVASIEYDFVMNRVYISTLIPEMPTQKRINAQINVTKGAIAPSASFTEPTLMQKEKVIEKEDYPTHGYVSGGGGSSQNISNFYQIIGGNDLTSDLGEVGIKKKLTVFNTEISDDTDILAGTPTTLPDGLGWGRSLDDNSFTLLLNDKNSGSSISLTNQTVFAVQTVNITSDAVTPPGTPRKIFPAKRIAGI